MMKHTIPVPEPVLLDVVDSTNTYARTHFDQLPDGTMVAARCQTAGRGRRGRAWLSPAGQNIYATFLFKHLADGFHGGCLVGVGALACLREAAPGVDAFLKWPNDLYVRERKLAGLLCESARIEAGRITGAVAGIGINVNLPPEELLSVDQPATSLLAEEKREFNLEILTKRLAETVFRYYITYLNSADALLAEWRSANRLIGRKISVTDSYGSTHEGIFRAISADGSMIFEENGQMKCFTCCDVKINRESVDWNHLT